MHGACGNIDTACPNKIFEQLQKVKIISKMAMICKKIKNACVVIDNGCTGACRVIDTKIGVRALS
jgi:hypothetical protein